MTRAYTTTEITETKCSALEESQLDYYKLNKILQVYGLNVRVAFIDNFTKLPYFELH